jgi:hypothetical protein
MRKCSKSSALVPDLLKLSVTVDMDNPSLNCVLIVRGERFLAEPVLDVPDDFTADRFVVRQLKVLVDFPPWQVFS